MLVGPRAVTSAAAAAAVVHPRCACSDAAHSSGVQRTSALRLLRCGTHRAPYPTLLTLRYPSVQGVLARLRELPVDTAALQTCSIGRTMNRLKKAGPAALREPAARLVAEWKRVVDEEGATAGPPAGGAGGLRAGGPSGGGGGDAKRDRSRHCAVSGPASRCTDGSMRPAACGLSRQLQALLTRRCLHCRMRSLDSRLVGPQTPRISQVCESGALDCAVPPLTISGLQAAHSADLWPVRAPA